MIPNLLQAISCRVSPNIFGGLCSIFQCSAVERVERVGGRSCRRGQGRSGKSTDGRDGFHGLVADVGLGRVGIVLGIEVSRLARDNTSWYQLLDLCAYTDTLIADSDGIYHPGLHNDRLLLGLSVTVFRPSLTSSTRV